jgi:hypothetical protein
MVVNTTFVPVSYTGELFLVGKGVQTPLLSQIGGLNGSNARIVQDWEFVEGVFCQLNAASIQDIDEDEMNTAPTPSQYTHSQAKNCIQIWRESYSIGDAKLAMPGRVKTTNAQGWYDSTQPPAIQDPLAAERQYHVLQMATNIELALITGTKQIATASNVAPKMGGFLEAGFITSHVVDCGSADITRLKFNELVRKMVDDEVPMDQLVLYAGSYVLQTLSQLFTWAPADRNVGGTQLKVLLTDFAPVAVQFIPKLSALDSALLLHINDVYPVFAQVPSKPLVFHDILPVEGSAHPEMITTMFGVDRGPQIRHGKFTNVKSS